MREQRRITAGAVDRAAAETQSYAMIQTGLEVIVTEQRHLLRERRVGLVTHPAAVLPDLTSSADALQEAGARIVAFFGMEHGFAGAVADGAAVGDAQDSRIGVPIYSLYGPTREPTPNMLAGLDVLVVDIQDVGVRFYTFISTLFYVLRAAGKQGLPVIVLDRPNPINGVAIEGPLVAPGLESFVGIAPLPIRYGLTIGELARYFNAEHGLHADLHVVPMRGWRRSMWFDETGLPWVPTSPAMPQLSTTIVYPGTCLVEGTNLSEGRGTALPFEVVGAPWLDGYALATRLNRCALSGARFRPVEFIPSASKHAGVLCLGVQVHVVDRAVLRPVALGLEVVAHCRALARERFEFLPASWEGRPPHFDLLTGDARIRQGLDRDMPVAELTAAWDQIAAAWTERSRPYWLYA